MKGVISNLDSLKETKFNLKSHKGLLKAIKVWSDLQIGGFPEPDVLRASGLHFVCPREFVLNYWNPKASNGFDWKSEMMMGVGTHLHKFLQDKVLGPMGVLRGNWEVVQPGALTVTSGPGYRPPGYSWEYIETQVYDPHWRIRGHIDGELSLARIQFLQEMCAKLKKANGLFDEVVDLEEGPICLLEIKTAGKYVYDKINTWEDLPDYYRMQATIYQKLSGKDLTVFWYIARDSMDSKIILYQKEESLWKEATRKARIIWEAIRDETLPESSMACILPTDTRAKKCPHKDACWSKAFDFTAFVNRAKKLGEQQGRKFLDLSNWKSDDPATIIS